MKESPYIRAELRRVRLERGDRAVLRDIDWTIRPAERWILAGANGAGKTQLLKLIAGRVWPTPTGEEVRRYVLRGERYSSPFGVNEEIAYLGPEQQDKYERYGWNSTAELVVGTGLYRTDIPLDPLTARDRRIVAALLARLSVAHLAGREFLTLSHGERRLVLLARVLAARPKLLLLDELLDGLDAGHRGAALGWLNRTGRSRLPWVLATHRLENVPRSASHALVLEDGRIAYRGPIARAPLERLLGAGPSEERATMRTDAGAGPSFGGVPGRVVGAAAGHAPGAVSVRVPSGRANRLRRRARRVLVRLVRASVYLDERQVLRDLSLEIAEGDCWVVHGPNGSGKTTLLRTIYGDHGVAAGGRIERAGIGPGIPLDTFQRTVGLVAPHLQASLVAMRSVLPSALESAPSPEPQDLTIDEVVQSGCHASVGLDAPPSLGDRRAARRAFAAFGLSPLEGRTVRELSYGQLRRVLFARAWVSAPRLLLLDEPFAGLDAGTRHGLLEALAALTAAGATLVMATHHREEWPLGVTHELELDGGESRYCGPARSQGANSAGGRAGI